MEEDRIVVIRKQIQDAMEEKLSPDEINTVNQYIDLHMKVMGSDNLWDKFETEKGLYYELLRAIEDLSKGKSIEEALPSSHYTLVNGKYKHVNTSGGRRQRKNRTSRKNRKTRKSRR
jgi:hypothetical protein